MNDKMPVHYFGLMILAGFVSSQIVRSYPALANATVPPLVWLIGVALIYEIIQKAVPKLALVQLNPMQRFLGYFTGAILYLLIVKMSAASF